MKKRQIPFNNKELRKALLKEENIPLVERLLQEEHQKLLEIRRYQETAPNPKRFSKEDFGNLQEGIKTQVNNLVGYSPEKDCTIIYGGSLTDKIATKYAAAATAVGGIATTAIATGASLKAVAIFLGLETMGLAFYKAIGGFKEPNVYKARLRRVKIAREEKEKVIPNLAHEYTHHILCTKGYTQKESALQEGFCRGIERQIAEDYAEKENNPFFMEGPTEKTLSSLKVGYKLLCNRLKKKPNESLLKNINHGRSFKDKILDYFRKIDPNAMHYNLGNTLFMVTEEKQGRGFYKDIIDNKFAFN